MKVTVEDVLHHIAQDMRAYSGADRQAAIEEFLEGCVIELRMSITSDVEATELNYLERYGKGHTFYFRLRDYQHGKQLASELFFAFRGVHPNMDGYTGSLFGPDDTLYLFIHVVDINAPVVAAATACA